MVNYHFLLKVTNQIIANETRFTKDSNPLLMLLVVLNPEEGARFVYLKHHLR